MNQYEVPQGSNPFSGVHPVLILGIVIFIIPFFESVLRWNIPGWISGLGIITILIGAGLSIFKSSQ